MREMGITNGTFSIFCTEWKVFLKNGNWGGNPSETQIGLHTTMSHALKPIETTTDSNNT